MTISRGSKQAKVVAKSIRKLDDDDGGESSVKTSEAHELNEDVTEKMDGQHENKG